jgi:acyl phosphate:glycerol-3-phosphate acyltransferase
MPGTADQGDLLVPLLIAAVAGYILGSLPFGYLVARSRGVDIFNVGSKSSGATNVRRVLGSGAGNMVLVLDLLKGAVAAGWPLLIAWGAIRAFNVPSVLGYVGLGFALLGHSFSCFTKFRGGKGVATGAGGFAVLMPNVAAAAVIVWLLVFFAARYVSLASIAAALTLPAAAFLFHRDALALLAAAVVALFVVVRHRANVGRLLNGTEKRIDGKKEASQKP